MGESYSSIEVQLVYSTAPGDKTSYSEVWFGFMAYQPLLAI